MCSENLCIFVQFAVQKPRLFKKIGEICTNVLRGVKNADGPESNSD